MRYDGNDFEVSLDAKDPSKRFRFCYDIMAADDVIYALTHCVDSEPRRPAGPLVGYDVWASPDMGDSWYRIQTLTYDQGVEGQIVKAGWRSRTAPPMCSRSAAADGGLQVQPPRRGGA